MTARGTPPGQPPATPAARNTWQGVVGQRASARSRRLHTRSRRMSAADPSCLPQMTGSPGKGERLTPDAPREGTRHPPTGMPSPRRHSAQRQLARACAVGLVQGPHACGPPAQETPATGPGYLPQGSAAGRGRAPNSSRPSQRPDVRPSGNIPAPLLHATPNKVLQAKGRVPGPHACAAATTARGQRTTTACPKDGQPGDGERLTPDAPHEGTKHPPPGDTLLPCRQRVTPAHKSVRWCVSARSPHPRPPRPGNTSNRPQLPAPRRGSRERKSASLQPPFTTARGSPPGQPLAAPAAGNTQQDVVTQGASAAPPRLPAQPRPQHVGCRPQLPGPSTGSRGSVSAYPKTPLTKAQRSPPADALLRRQQGPKQSR